MGVRAAAAAVKVAPVDVAPVNVAVVPNLGRNKMELAVTHAALACGLVRERSQLGGRATQDGNLQAGIVVEMDMHRGHLQIVMAMLRFGEPLAERARRRAEPPEHPGRPGLVLLYFAPAGRTARRCKRHPLPSRRAHRLPLHRRQGVLIAPSPSLSPSRGRGT